MARYSLAKDAVMIDPSLKLCQPNGGPYQGHELLYRECFPELGKAALIGLMDHPFDRWELG